MGSIFRCLILVVLIVGLIVPAFPLRTVHAQMSQVFFDDFNYSSLSDLQSAGYVIQQHPELVSVGDSCVTLVNTGNVNGYVTYTNLNNIVSDWKIEAKLTVDSGYFSILLDVYIDGLVPGYANPGYFYRWGADGYPGREAYTVTKYTPAGTGAGVAERLPGYSPPAFGTWVTLAVARVGDQLNFYYNDNLITTYTETHPVTLTGFGMAPWWPTTTSYDSVGVDSYEGFAANHASFSASSSGSTIQLSLSYTNFLGENVVIYFIITDTSGTVVDHPSATAPNGQSGTVSATSKSLSPATYHVSWIAYRASDTSLKNPIDWSTSAEQKTVTIGGPPTVSVTVYSIDVQYLGQDPATETDLYGSIYNSYQKSASVTTYTISNIPINTQVTFSVSSNPSGCNFANWWDDYAQSGQQNVASLTINVGTKNHEIAAFFTPTGSISSFVPPKGVFKPGDTIPFSVKVKNKGSVDQFEVLLYVSMHCPTCGVWTDTQIFSTQFSAESHVVVTVSYQWHIPNSAWPGTYGVGAELLSGNTILDSKIAVTFMVDTGQSYVEIGGPANTKLIHIHLSKADLKSFQIVIANGNNVFGSALSKYLLSQPAFASGDLKTFAQAVGTISVIPIYLKSGKGGFAWGSISILYYPYDKGRVEFYGAPPYLLFQAALIQDIIDLVSTLNDVFSGLLSSLFNLLLKAISFQFISSGLNLPDTYSFMT